MKVHVEEFMKFWDFTQADKIRCWVPNCHNVAVDIMHIEPKGMGGRDSVEFIENYIPGCRQCHDKCAGRPLWKEILYDTIVFRIKKFKKKHQWSEKFKLTSYFRNSPNVK